MKKIELNERLTQLSVALGGYFNGRAAATKEDGIYLLEHQPSVPGFVSYIKVYPLLSELRKNKDFICACIEHFAEDHEDDFLADLCKWIAGWADKCPVYDFDLFFIPGDFHKDIVFFDGEEPMSREKLIVSIEKKFHDGYVLDHTKMKCDRIAYESGDENDYDSINGEWLPCLVTNNNDEVAVDYFERDEFASLAEQLGITSGSEYTLDIIQTPYLHHILYSMVRP